LIDDRSCNGQATDTTVDDSDTRIPIHLFSLLTSREDRWDSWVSWRQAATRFG
jgi:hypothetical protein